MDRLTHERCNGMKAGYWSAAKKDELVRRLGAYEDTGLTPEKIMGGKMLTGWIPMSERVPDSESRVLMYRPCMKDTDVGPISVQWGWARKYATHWMPLPEAPGN